jgi:glycosyltransferase involved in cell wall biosynthesis
MPRFSVIIPTCDRPELLAKAVGSVMAQRFDDFELIIVNDGHAPVENDGAVVINTGGYRGHVVARNLGLAKARGEFIAFLDDDDRWIDADHLARASLQLSKRPGLYHAAGFMTFDGSSKPLLFDKLADAASLAADNTILISTVCYPCALHGELGPFDETLTYYADWDWYLRVARAGYPVSHSREPAAEILQHGQNMSGNHAEDARRLGLNALCAKHGLGPLPLKTHLTLVQQGAGGSI